MSRRTERLASTIQQELAQIIMRELNDPRLTGMPSITRVKVSPDMSIADVYVTIMGTPGQQSAALNALRHSAADQDAVAAGGAVPEIPY
jgi:ribosome-binding factor A